MQHHAAFRAMNTDINVLVEVEGWAVPPLDAFLSLQLLFEAQEQRFSRFRPTSLLSALNRGETVADPYFLHACHMALDAHEFTAGLFNPMVLPALAEAGYDRSFETLTSGGEPRPQPVPDPRKCLAIDGDTVRLTGGQLDLGGIIKGWTVDLAVESLGDRFPNLFVNAGGDLRCTGAEEGHNGWAVTVDSPSGGKPAWEGVIQGAMATSTSGKRRWTTTSGRSAHHLIDPRTGLPADSPYAQVTAWAPQTWVAETWAKAVLVGGPAALDLAHASGIRTFVVQNDGR